MASNVSSLASSAAARFPLMGTGDANTADAQDFSGAFTGGWPASLDAAPVVTLVTDRKGRVCFVNKEGRAVIGAAAAEALLSGQALSEAFTRESRKLIAGEAIRTALRSGVWRGEAALVNRWGQGTPVAVSISARTPSDKWLVCVACDIAHQKKRERRLEHLATHDALTGLPNLTLFSDRLGREIYRARRSSRPFALLFTDVDRFKEINDTLGHECANRVLAELAARLYASVRSVDTVARYGGDEFAIILSSLNDAREAEAIIGRVRACTTQPFVALDSSIELSISIGVAMFPSDASSAEELLMHADREMYRGKRHARHVAATNAALLERASGAAAVPLGRH
jgi:diguanylate cyclase (GGDEF)-like protein/PAS domain S-box-containing protein